MRKLFAVALFLFASPAVLAADVYVTEYPRNYTVTYQAVVTPPLASQKIAITASSVQSAAFNASTTIIRVHCDAVCSVQIGGTNPTATTSSARLAAGQTEYFMVTPGDKLAVIENL
jgi:hypothetical protein